jgi:hypothetical protein
MQNVVKLVESGRFRGVHVMCTINALCLDSLPEFLEQLIEFKKKYGKDGVKFSLNILRFPSFQSPLILPADIKTQYKENLSQWLARHADSDYMHEYEINHTLRLIDYLDIVKTPHSDAFEMPTLHNDFYQFFSQYDIRRHKNFRETFPNLKEWYDSLQIQQQ